MAVKKKKLKLIIYPLLDYKNEARDNKAKLLYKGHISPTTEDNKFWISI